MTPQILDGIPANAVTYLINALSFDMYSKENVYLNDGDDAEDF